MRRLPALASLAAPLVVLGLVSACAAPRPAGDRPRAGADGAAEAAEKARSIETARLKLELAELDAEESQRQARSGLDKAERELDEARLDLALFLEREREARLLRARLDLDRDVQRAREAEQELQQMEEMYAAETNLDASGERTRDLVLERSRARLEFARRDLALSQRALQVLEEHELPKKERELAAKAQAAEAALADARGKLRKAELDGRASVLEARGRLEKAERGGTPEDGRKERS